MPKYEVRGPKGLSIEHGNTPNQAIDSCLMRIHPNLVLMARGRERDEACKVLRRDYEATKAKV